MSKYSFNNMIRLDKNLEMIEVKSYMRIKIQKDMKTFKKVLDMT